MIGWDQQSALRVARSWRRSLPSGAVEGGTAALANPQTATAIVNAVAEAGASDALGGASLAVGASLTGRARVVGDLTDAEVKSIQGVVNDAGRPLEVVGSAAKGTRTSASDIDYVVPPASLKYFEGLEVKLPSLDPSHGIIPGVGNPNLGPVLRFEPEAFP